jgi:hypothetical protein
MKKYTRQTKILELITKTEVETQEELAEALKNMGIEVTQATISRDIKELRLVKVMSKSGKYKYATISQSQEGITDRLNKIFENSVVSILLKPFQSFRTPFHTSFISMVSASILKSANLICKISFACTWFLIFTKFPARSVTKAKPLFNCFS